MNMSVKRNRSFSSSRVAFAALGLSVLTACGGGQGGMKMGDNQFAVEAVKATSSNQSEQYPATIKGLQDIEVRPQVSGLIVKLCVDEGATVRKGQALFQIDPTQYKAAYDQAAASVKSAKANLETITATERNKKMLHDQKIISDFEYLTAVNNLLTAKANLAQAGAAYTAAKQNLDFCTVKSPSDGVIGTFPYRIGALVSPSISEPLTTVSEIGDMYVYFSMTEKQLLDLTRAGGTLKEQLEKMPAVKLQLADGTMYDAEGKIDAVSGVIDQTTGSVSMRAIFPNKQNILRSGGMANVVFPYTMSEIILIPQTATQEIQDKKFVYVLQPDSTLKHTEIQISNLNDGKNYIVTGGLKEGDQIVVEGVQTLQDGQKISPITVAQKEAKYQQALQDQRDGNIQTAFN
ncbi:efflux RND transporter periplasmic adaptor subunit [Phocaeicola coprophilus]|uniref:efflux RND transporter periplasmic adaptor subunit n=1 Tax=Phocaeicola coprophilus TaxID=387090 RepID=UPI001E18A84B|nr:efflux RND transporter periplasmic adaptor subunit [Phocaeicola coprophilus]HJE47316.1 efflux RND transporter periplasmic adaptor subunit [Phocaeicola coprophilus]